MRKIVIPRLERFFNPRSEIGYFGLAIQALKVQFSMEMLWKDIFIIESGYKMTIWWTKLFNIFGLRQVFFYDILYNFDNLIHNW